MRELCVCVAVSYRYCNSAPAPSPIDSRGLPLLRPVALLRAVLNGPAPHPKLPPPPPPLLEPRADERASRAEVSAERGVPPRAERGVPTKLRAERGVALRGVALRGVALRGVPKPRADRGVPMPMLSPQPTTVAPLPAPGALALLGSLEVSP